MTCYDPHGNNVTGSGEFVWVPCTNIHPKSGDNFVPCCQIPNGYTCLESLMCQKFQAAPYETLNVRGGCTDPTFKSANCPQFCLSGDMENGDNFISDCGNGTGCCNTQGWQTPCSCQAGAPNALALGIDTIVSLTSTSSSAITQLSTTSSSTSLTTTSTTSSLTNAVSSSAPSSTTSASAPSSSDLGIKAGVPVGIVGGFALLAALIIFLYRRLRYQHSRVGQTHEKNANTEPGLFLG